MPPNNEQFEKAELRHKLIYGYGVRANDADVALRKAQEDGEAPVPGFGLVIRKVHSAPGLKFTLHGTGR